MLPCDGGDAGAAAGAEVAAAEGAGAHDVLAEATDAAAEGAETGLAAAAALALVTLADGAQSLAGRV